MVGIRMSPVLIYILILAPVAVESFNGVECGDFKCVNDPNVYCDAVTKTCECAEGFIGNGRIQCVPQNKSICYMMGDPHITTFNGESAFIFLPCTQILADLTLPGEVAATGPRIWFKVTAITHEMYEARYASQLMIVGLYIQITNYENSTLSLRCDTNGCWETKAPYSKFTENRILNLTVVQDDDNGQTVITLEEIQVKFRAEDGSVSIEIPDYAKTDESHPGLCNRNRDPGNFNAVTAEALHLEYDEYILYIATGNIHLYLEKNPECLRRYHNPCTPPLREAETVQFCGRIFIGSFRECYYDYRNKNSTVLMNDYNNCHADACARNTSVSYCNDIAAACGQNSQPERCP